MSSQRLGIRSTKTAEKSRMAGKSLAKFAEKGATESRDRGEEQNGKALPRVVTAEKSRMASKRLAKRGGKGATESRTRDLRITSATLYR